MPNRVPNSDDQGGRRREAAILAALDFEPRIDRPARTVRRRHRLLLFLALGVAHVLLAVNLARTLAAGHGGLPLLVAALAWGGGTAVVVGVLVRTTLGRTCSSILGR